VTEPDERRPPLAGDESEQEPQHGARDSGEDLPLRKLSSARLSEPADNSEPGAEGAVADEARTARSGQSYVEVGDQVAGILQAAEATAEQLIISAREEAASIRRQAEVAASVQAEELAKEAGRVRSEVDDYVSEVRQLLAEAEEGALKTLAEAETQARSVREAGERMAPRAPRVRRFELAAVFAVMSRDVTVFLQSWRSTTFSAVVEPTIFLLAFGLGFGALISRVAGLDYIQFVGTGVIATTVVFSSAFPGMFQTMIKGKLQHVHDALLAAPVNVGELVTAEVLWIAIRAGVYSMAPVAVVIGFGLRPGWGVVLVPLIALLTGFGFAAFGVTVAAESKSFNNFSYIISGVLTPLLLVAGAYFPVDTLPDWALTLDQLNPLYHCVELVRHAIFGFGLYYEDLRHLGDLAHLGALLVFALLMWRLAIWRMRPQLVN
jgi:lipooligosaccharide transport system permease protein